MKNLKNIYILSFVFIIFVIFSFYFILLDSKKERKNNNLVFSNNRSLAYNLDREQ